MATYKLIQDIEAEDHILGPLTLRQFIYALIATFFFYLSFVFIMKRLDLILIVVLPPGFLFAFLAFPFRRDQPTEVWALAKVRFMFKPRRRIWDQSGKVELVTITVPKKAIKHLTKDMSQSEVKSRLEVLASTIDSRGWAIKNPNPQQAGGNQITVPSSSDRLIDISSIPKPVPDFTEEPGEDILDEKSSAVAEQFSQLIQASTNQHRQNIINNLNDIRQNNSTPTPPILQDTQTVLANINEQQLSEQLKESQLASSMSNANLHTLSSIPTNDTIPIAEPAKTPMKPMPKIADSVILNLASNNDLSISAIANEAHKATEYKEVVIELH